MQRIIQDLRDTKAVCELDFNHNEKYTESDYVIYPTIF